MAICPICRGGSGRRNCRKCRGTGSVPGPGGSDDTSPGDSLVDALIGGGSSSEDGGDDDD